MSKAIIVTTPKSQMKTAAAEARMCINAGEGFYFRRFGTLPLSLATGIRIFYVEDGYVRGFATVSEVHDSSSHSVQCTTTGCDWAPGIYAVMPADTWQWVKPIPYKGFQGFRYFDDSDVEIVGGWLDPKPEIGDE